MSGSAFQRGRAVLMHLKPFLKQLRKAKKTAMWSVHFISISNTWKRYGKWGGRPFRALSDQPVARQMSLFLFICFWNQSACKSALLFWSYNHHLGLLHLAPSWEISLKSIEKEGRMEGLLRSGCRREPAFISKCVNWKMCSWNAK